VRREDAERFIDEVRKDEPDLARYLHIEERELEAGGHALRLTIGEVDGEEPVRAIETLELHLATLGELDS
jgi:hypothetical protein